MIAALLIAAAALAEPAFLHEGDEAPAFNGPLYNPEAAGVRNFDLASLVGDSAEDEGAKAVLVSFFATWCGPCKKELPVLQALSKEFAARGLRVVSVAIDRDPAAMAEAKALLEKNGVTYPVVKDRFNLIARRWLGQKTTLPSLFIVGRDGTIRLVQQGYEKDAAAFLHAEVEKALGGAGSGPAATPADPLAGRPVIYLTSKDLAGKPPSPLLVVLHCYSCTPELMQARLKLETLVEEAQLVVALPRGLIDSKKNPFWNATPACCDFEHKAPDDVAYLRAVIDDAAGKHRIDPKLVWLMGWSNGGFFALRAACELGDKVAGAVSIAGGATAGECKGSRPVAILGIHGDRDDIVPIEGGELGGGLVRTGKYAPLEEILQSWAARDGCAAKPLAGPKLDLDTKVAGAETQAFEWPGCKSGGVALWKMQGVGHVPAFAPDFALQAVQWLLAHPREKN